MDDHDDRARIRDTTPLVGIHDEPAEGEDRAGAEDSAERRNFIGVMLRDATGTGTPPRDPDAGDTGENSEG